MRLLKKRASGAQSKFEAMADQTMLDRASEAIAWALMEPARNEGYQPKLLHPQGLVMWLIKSAKIIEKHLVCCAI